MNNLEKLEQEAFDANVNIYTFDLGNDNANHLLKGLYVDSNIALDISLKSNTEKVCILAEEMGHHQMNNGNILNMKNIQNRKQELKARLWAYNNQVGLCGIINAYKHGCRCRYEVAQYLEVTEDFLQAAIDCYADKYGTRITIDNHTIFFIPQLAVMELYV